MGGWTAISVGISSWLGKVSSERLISRWRANEQAQLESIRGELANDRLLLESATKSFQSGQNLYQEKRLTAVELLWQEVLTLREKFSAPVFFFTILVPSEYDNALNSNDYFNAYLKDVDDEFIVKAVRGTEGIEKSRPYLGETLWLQFFIYRAFLCRLAYLITKAKKKGQFSGDWRDDSGVRQLLPTVLGADMTDGFLKLEGGSILVNTATGSLEALMLKEISLITSGSRSSSESFENAAQLRKIIAGLEPIKEK
jgi:exonuclease VII small subunit